MLSAEEGYVKNGNGDYVLETDAELTCPVCGSRLKRNGRRRRVFFDELGARHYITIQRFICTGKGCSRTQHALPENVLPFKRYLSQCIEKAVSVTDNQCIAENTTQHAWRRWICSLAEAMPEDDRRFLGIEKPCSLQSIARNPGLLYRIVYSITKINSQQAT